MARKIYDIVYILYTISISISIQYGRQTYPRLRLERAQLKPLHQTATLILDPLLPVRLAGRDNDMFGVRLDAPVQLPVGIDFKARWEFGRAVSTILVAIRAIDFRIHRREEAGFVNGTGF
ncbi:hypothetical protein I7I48_02986 [Histoplasma ohiense]|nr:hypothetical protein I7I48_02986 [Histoplasma ohiense (nom. inval.)]